ncbi:hypothetical protein [Mesorhizobium sp. M0684]|uniref:hypothetical protein n=1 Tax=unclassified Mesorhizobium TaxID=325217 RepID=UPI0033372583
MSRDNQTSHTNILNPPQFGCAARHHSCGAVLGQSFSYQSWDFEIAVRATVFKEQLFFNAENGPSRRLED